jgi:DNA segregation ATPase FtsK/SpoIIIE, S-DNA-T family
MSEAPNVYPFPQATATTYADVADRLEQVERGGVAVDELDVPDWLKDDQPKNDRVPPQQSSSPEVPPQQVSGTSGSPDASAAPTSTALVDEDQDDEDGQEDGEARRRFHKVRVVATHKHTKTVIRQPLYVATGAAVARSRRRDDITTARHQRMMRLAEVQGDHQTALEWETRAAHHRAERHRRRMELLKHAPEAIAKAVVTGAVLITATLGVLGVILAWHDSDIAQVARPFKDTASFVQTTLAVMDALWYPALLLAASGGLAWLWRTGRTHAKASNTGWAAALLPASSEVSFVITADGIVRALQNLGVSKLNSAFKEGWIPPFHTTPIREGQGYRAIFELPLGVMASDLADKRKLFARNLHRAQVEVWITDAVETGSGKAGVVDLWVADAGALNRPAPEYPLLVEGIADVFTGVPIGVTPRGTELLAPIVGNNGVFGGMMGQGKSNACRVVMAGCALDPLAELWVYVFAGNGDFDAYTPRLARYHRGATDAVVAAGLGGLRELYDEVGRREDRLAELNAKKLTRALAEEHADLRPRVVLFSECHELFGHKEMGEEAADVAVNTIRRARKTGIVLLFDTQSSRKEAIPPKIVELVSVNTCFAVKSWRSNDGFLGDGSFQAGIRATELRPGRDRGTSLTTGVSDEQFEILKWYFIAVDDDKGFDAATDIITRAMGGVAAGTQVKDTAKAAPPVEVRELLADLATILAERDEPVPAADIPALLRTLAPKWRAYAELNGKGLVKILGEEYGIKVPSTGNRWPVDPKKIREAAARHRAGVSAED